LACYYLLVQYGEIAVRLGPQDARVDQPDEAVVDVVVHHDPAGTGGCSEVVAALG